MRSKLGGLSDWGSVQKWRLGVQVTVLCGLGLLPWAQMQGWDYVFGSFYALDVFGLPFADPLSVVHSLSQGTISAPKLWIGAGLSLLLALVFGRIFCGWICPYGLFSEYVWRWRSAGKATKAQASLRPLRALWLRTGLLLCCVALSTVWALPLLLILSMPGALSLLPLAFWYGGALLTLLALPMAVLVLEALTRRRLWWQWLCPQSVLLSWAARLGKKMYGIRWQAKACTCPKNHRPCEGTCSLSLPLRQVGGPPRAECLQCAACVSACQTQGQGALSLSDKK